MLWPYNYYRRPRPIIFNEPVNTTKTSIKFCLDVLSHAALLSLCIYLITNSFDNNTVSVYCFCLLFLSTVSVCCFSLLFLSTVSVYCFCLLFLSTVSVNCQLLIVLKYQQQKMALKRIMKLHMGHSGVLWGVSQNEFIP